MCDRDGGIVSTGLTGWSYSFLHACDGVQLTFSIIQTHSHHADNVDPHILDLLMQLHSYLRQLYLQELHLSVRSCFPLMFKPS